MATAQQAQFADTIRAMKLAMKRKSDDSDSDDSIHAHTNRGNKLKKRAKFVREGRLDDTGGLAYRKKVSHAGYSRYIISNNPPLYDPDGDVYSPAESENERDASPVEDNAFGEVQLERLLRPLTAASELPDHPSLSLAFKSKALTQMAEDALDMVRKERENLWKAKRLLQRFRGDADWVPCESFETEQDEMMLLPNELGPEIRSAPPSVAMEQSIPEIEMAPAADEGDSVSVPSAKVEGDAMDGVETMDMALQRSVQAQVAAEQAHSDSKRESAEHGEPRPETNGDTSENHEGHTKLEVGQHVDATDCVAHTSNRPFDPADGEHAEEASENTSNSGKDTNAPSHAMTTRARARSPVASRTPSPTPSDSGSILPIHPWYAVPPTSLPDRDLGLPTNEAEDVRRLLFLYCQKQEQVVRGLDQLYSGLQRADRLRRDVWRACRAEGHMKEDGKGNLVTEMSDGEDWYDPEDLGLQWSDMKLTKNGTYGLEKGKDEVEDAEEEGRRGGRRRRVNRM